MEPAILRASPADFLTPRKTAGYVPSVLQGDWYGRAIDDKPWFTQREALRMRRDPQIQFCLRVLRAPLYRCQWTVEADSMRVAKLVDSTIRTFWESSLRAVLTSQFTFGWVPGEITHRSSIGQVVLDSVDDIHPNDAKPLEVENKHGAQIFCGIRVRGLNQQNRSSGMAGQSFDVYNPHSFWHPGENEYGSYYGRPRLADAYGPWAEKSAKGGAIESRRLWFKKCAFRGGSMRHPMGETEYEVAGGGTITINNEDLARQIVERYENGGVLTLPNTKDPTTGEYLWIFEPPGSNGEATGIREYPQDLDKEVQVGMGIPNEVIQAAETGSGYSGRSIPMMVFMASCDEVAAGLMRTAVVQLCRPLVGLNCGPKHVRRFKVKLKPLGEVFEVDKEGGKSAFTEPQGQQQQPGGFGGMGGDPNGPGGGNGDPSKPKPSLQLSQAAMLGRLDRIAVELSQVGNFNPNEPRDNTGQWTAGGGSTASKPDLHTIYEHADSPEKHSAIHGPLKDEQGNPNAENFDTYNKIISAQLVKEKANAAIENSALGDQLEKIDDVLQDLHGEVEEATSELNNVIDEIAGWHESVKDHEARPDKDDYEAPDPEDLKYMEQEKKKLEKNKAKLDAKLDATQAKYDAKENEIKSYSDSVHAAAKFFLASKADRGELEYSESKEVKNLAKAFDKLEEKPTPKNLAAVRAAAVPAWMAIKGVEEDRDIVEAVKRLAVGSAPKTKAANLSMADDQPRDEAGRFASPDSTVSIKRKAKPEATEAEPEADDDVLTRLGACLWAAKNGGKCPREFADLTLAALENLDDATFKATVDAVSLNAKGNRELVMRHIRQELRMSDDGESCGYDVAGTDPLELSQASDGVGRWITIGAKEGPDGKKHGGSPVFIKNGVIEKGHASLKGKTIESLRSDNHHANRHRREVEKHGHDPKHLDHLAGQMREHHNAHAGDHNEMLKTARTELLHHANKAQHIQGGKNKGLPNFDKIIDKGSDHTKIKGFDLAAERAAREFPHLFKAENGENGSHEDQLFDHLVGGNRKLMTDEHAYEEAFNHLMSQEPHKPDENAPKDEDIFADDGHEDEPRDSAEPEASGDDSFDFGGKSENNTNNPSTAVDKPIDSSDTTPVETKLTQGNKMTETKTKPTGIDREWSDDTTRVNFDGAYVILNNKTGEVVRTSGLVGDRKPTDEEIDSAKSEMGQSATKKQAQQTDPDELAQFSIKGSGSEFSKATAILKKHGAKFNPGTKTWTLPQSEAHKIPELSYIKRHVNTSSQEVKYRDWSDNENSAQ